MKRLTTSLILFFSLLSVIHAQPGAALNFDGTSNYLNIGTPITSASGYTKEAWIYANASGSCNIISSNSSPFWLSGGKISVAHHWGSSGTVTIQDPASFVLNTWTHIAVTYDLASTTLNLYKNGVLVATSAAVPGYLIETIQIGEYGGGNYFQGTMDEVRIWNYARNQCQIQATMNCELAGSQPGLLTYYQFNEGIAAGSNTAVNTVTDVSGNSNTGTLVNFTLTGTTSNWVTPGAVTSGNSCMIVTSLSINNSPSNAVICAGADTSFTVAAAGTGLTYQWQVNSGSGFAGISNTGPYTNTTAASMQITNATIAMNNYQYRCIVTGAYCDTVRSVPATLTINPLPVSTASVKNIICYGTNTGQVTVSVSGGTPSYTYSWSQGKGSASAADSLLAGNYTCTITDAGNCSILQTATVTQPSLPFIASLIDDHNITCNGGYDGYIEVTESGGAPYYNYSWSNGRIGSGIYGQPSGTYTCTITDANSCKAMLVTSISEPSAISTTITSKTNVSCNGGNNGASVISASGGTGALTYSWSPSGGTTVSVSNLTAGIYTCSITDANGCPGSITDTIKQPGPVNVSLTATSSGACSGGADTIIAGGFITSYSWSPAAGLNSTNTVKVTATITSSVTYTLTGTNSSGCTGSNTITLTLNPNPPTPVITANGNILTASGTGTLFQWYLNGNPVSGASFQTDTAMLTGNYTVEETNGYGCSAVSASYPFTVTGWNVQTATEALKLYPNPSADDVTLELTDAGQHTEFCIYDMLGRHIKTIVITGTTIIHNDELPQGIYSYRVIRDKVLIGSGKLLMQR